MFPASLFLYEYKDIIFKRILKMFACFFEFRRPIKYFHMSVTIGQYLMLYICHFFDEKFECPYLVGNNLCFYFQD